LLKEAQRIGRELVKMGLISSHGGNLSVRMGDMLLITRRGCMLGDLKKGDIIETGLEKEDSKVVLASSELIVHRAIYQATAALAIVHCHPPSAIALSLEMDAIVPLDSEGSYLLHRVPVVATGKTIGSEEVAQLLPPVLKEYKIAMLRGHGSFAVGQMLEEALMLSSALEVSSKIFILARLLGMNIKEYRKEIEKYTTW
jgi:L-fuculose-phosphate aldolase